MSEQLPKTIYLKDYRVSDFLVKKVELKFELFEEETFVTANLFLRRNPDSSFPNAPLVLQGSADIALQKLSIDQQPLLQTAYQLSDKQLQIDSVPEEFTLQTVSRIEPHLNTSLEGLYRSDGVFCTQCEAEGFRRITYFLDRPDVMALYETTIVADLSRYPFLLSNGNKVDEGEFEDGRHWVRWQDPHPKPAYLFALVAGDLKVIQDQFITTSGRQVQLQIYADAKDHHKLTYAMDALKRAMRWDEKRYGREYDLDIYMIVAVDFFNMGAMENKGLNIFNTSCVLATPETTTDTGFQRVEGVVAHEYFHNWSGNRVTCRDWFQLSLKEGFTVFRDAQFSAEMNSTTVKRIEDVTLLRTAQFAEDAGPMAHPVRPESFIEISNFYTLTVYEKGAEVVRMLHLFLGEDLFRQGCDLYFERHDGQAVTTDDFVSAMESVSGRDLSQFKNWYSTVGTPVVEVSADWQPQGTYQLHFKQSCSSRNNQIPPKPFHIPIKYGLLNQAGESISEGVIELTEFEQTISFHGLKDEPIPSLLRGFSAPVKLRYSYTDSQLLHLLKNDTDGFNRWEAAQRFWINKIERVIQGTFDTLNNNELEALKSLLQDTELDEAMLAKVFTLPSEAYLSELATEIDVEAIHQSYQKVKQEVAKQLLEEWEKVYQRCKNEAPYQPSAQQIAKRSLKNLALEYLMVGDTQSATELAFKQFMNADNMTDEHSALKVLVHSKTSDAAQAALDIFREKWKNDALVMNSWFAVQASAPHSDALEKIRQLETDSLFDVKNPNKLRSLISVFAQQNPTQFHSLDSSGYQYLAEWIITLNKQNPQIAARMLAPLTLWHRYCTKRQKLMKLALKKIVQQPDLSPDVYEVVSKSLGENVKND